MMMSMMQCGAVYNRRETMGALLIALISGMLLMPVNTCQLDVTSTEVDVEDDETVRTGYQMPQTPTPLLTECPPKDDGRTRPKLSDVHSGSAAITEPVFVKTMNRLDRGYRRTTTRCPVNNLTVMKDYKSPSSPDGKGPQLMSSCTSDRATCIVTRIQPQLMSPCTSDRATCIVTRIQPS